MCTNSREIGSVLEDIPYIRTYQVDAKKHVGTNYDAQIKIRYLTQHFSCLTKKTFSVYLRKYFLKHEIRRKFPLPIKPLEKHSKTTQQNYGKSISPFYFRRSLQLPWSSGLVGGARIGKRGKKKIPPLSSSSSFWFLEKGSSSLSLSLSLSLFLSSKREGATGALPPTPKKRGSPSLFLRDFAPATAYSPWRRRKEQEGLLCGGTLLLKTHTHGLTYAECSERKENK